MRHAAHRGDSKCLQALLEVARVPPDEPVPNQSVARQETGYPRGRSQPLHLLCQGQSPGDRAACFALLRAAGANLEAIDHVGCTPLHYAVQRKGGELASLLIEAGVCVNGADWYGNTPLSFAAWRNDTADIIAKLLRAGATANSLSLSDYMDHRAYPSLLRAGAKIRPNSRFLTPYLIKVRDIGGIEKYEQAHLAKLTRTFASKFRLPAQPARRVAEFWLHAGCY